MLTVPFEVESVAPHLLGLAQPLPLPCLHALHVHRIARHVDITLVIAARLTAMSLPVAHAHPTELELARAREVVAPSERRSPLELARRLAITATHVDPNRRLAFGARLGMRLHVFVGLAFINSLLLPLLNLGARARRVGLLLTRETKVLATHALHVARRALCPLGVVYRLTTRWFGAPCVGGVFVDECRDHVRLVHFPRRLVAVLYEDLSRHDLLAFVGRTRQPEHLRALLLHADVEILLPTFVAERVFAR
mmetsp:Transcript_12196/g.28440  ORF Transcript_12196/g.28440 Transcript_12196/m.28440 type:complete len:251 (-) Transcript_12196:2640-3392(-)